MKSTRFVIITNSKWKRRLLLFIVSVATSTWNSWFGRKGGFWKYCANLTLENSFEPLFTLLLNVTFSSVLKSFFVLKISGILGLLDRLINTLILNWGPDWDNNCYYKSRNSIHSCMQNWNSCVERGKYTKWKKYKNLSRL